MHRTVTPITQYVFDNFGPTAAQEDTIEVRTLQSFAATRKPIWMFSIFETIPENRVPSITVPVAFVHVTRRIMWKEESMEERLERIMYQTPASPSDSYSS